MSGVAGVADSLPLSIFCILLALCTFVNYMHDAFGFAVCSTLRFQVEMNLGFRNVSQMLAVDRSESTWTQLNFVSQGPASWLRCRWQSVQARRSIYKKDVARWVMRSSHVVYLSTFFQAGIGIEGSYTWEITLEEWQNNDTLHENEEGRMKNREE